MEHDSNLTRRGILQLSATVVAGIATTRGLFTDALAADAAALDRFQQQKAVNVKDRILLRGGTIISMDDKVGDLALGDVLIEGKKIVAVAHEIKAGGAQVIDARNMIIVPGLVDCHRHAWEGQLRGINPNSPTLADYGAATHQSLATAYRPQDYYVGNYFTAIGCIDAGVTCLIDNSNNSRSAAHSDAAVEALMDSGLRAIHASGMPHAGDWEKKWPGDLERLQKKHFSSKDQLVTLGMYARIYARDNKDNWAVARRLGIPISVEFLDPDMEGILAPLMQQKLVGPDNIFNHCGGLTEATWKMIVDSGAHVNVCPRSDAQYGLAEGVCALQAAWDHGIKPGLSVDNESSYGGDLFSEMRTAFFVQRALAQNRKFAGDKSPPKPISTRDVLYCATMGGAHCAGLDDKIGSIAPGKEADLILIRTDDINVFPLNNAVGTVVQAADRSNVDTVIIGGRVRKFRGKVVGLDMKRLLAMVDQSRSYLFATKGFSPDLFAEKLPKLN